MRRHPPPADDAALKCIPCNAPIVETTANGHVCVDCGETRVRRRTPRSIATERSGIRVEKTVGADDDGASRLEYVIESTRDVEVVVTIADTFRTDDDGPEPGIDPGETNRFWESTGPVAYYRRPLPARETVETALRVTPADVGRETVSRRPRIERIEPVAFETPGAAGNGEPPASERSRTVPEFARGATTFRGAPEPAGGTGPDARPTGSGPTGPGAAASNGAEGDAASGPAAPLEVLAAAPAYNEADTVADVVTRAKRVADDVVVVDDGSDDDTGRRAARAGATVIEHDRNRGYGAALKTIFREAEKRDADGLVVIDADGQHDPAEIPKLIEAQRRSGAEIVIGSRFVDGSGSTLPLYRRLGIKVINVLTNLSTGGIRSRSRVRDSQSGFRLYTGQAITELARTGWIGNRMDASIDVLLLAHERDFMIDEVGVTVDYEVANPSSRDPLRHGLQLFRNGVRAVARDRPLVSLAIPGVLVVAAGLGTGVQALVLYAQTGRLSMFLAVLAVLVVTIGALAGAMGVVLHALNTHFRRDVS